MGAPKGLLDLGGQPLLLWHVGALARLGPVTVVLGSDEAAYRAILPPETRVVVNPDWAATRMADSLRSAVVSLPPGPVLVTPVDVSPVTKATLALLLACGAPAVPVDRVGRDGHPVLLDTAITASIRLHAPDRGLRDLLVGAPRVAVPDPHVALDFDTPEDWSAFTRD